MVMSIELQCPRAETAARTKGMAQLRGNAVLGSRTMKCQDFWSLQVFCRYLICSWYVSGKYYMKSSNCTLWKGDCPGSEVQMRFWLEIASSTSNSPVSTVHVVTHETRTWYLAGRCLELQRTPGPRHAMSWKRFSQTNICFFTNFLSIHFKTFQYLYSNGSLRLSLYFLGARHAYLLICEGTGTLHELGMLLSAKRHSFSLLAYVTVAQREASQGCFQQGAFRRCPRTWNDSNTKRNIKQHLSHAEHIWTLWFQG